MSISDIDMKERNRVSQLPYLTLYFDRCEADVQGNIFWFTLRNDGNGTALEIEMSTDIITNNGKDRTAIYKDETTGVFYTLFDKGDAVCAHRPLTVGRSDGFALREYLNPAISSNPYHKIIIRFKYKDTYYNNYEQKYKVTIQTVANDTRGWIDDAPLPKLLPKDNA